MNYAQPLNQASSSAAMGAQGAANPYYKAATSGTQNALNAAQPLNQAAASGVQNALNSAQPYQQAATAGTQNALQAGQAFMPAAALGALAGGQAVNACQLQTDQYLSPYTKNVVEATQNALKQQFGQQNSQQQAEAIKSGAFGGDRAGLQRAALKGQQALAESQAISPLYQQAYNQALQTAQQHQGVGWGRRQPRGAGPDGAAARGPRPARFWGEPECGAAIRCGHRRPVARHQSPGMQAEFAVRSHRCAIGNDSEIS